MLRGSGTVRRPGVVVAPPGGGGGGGTPPTYATVLDGNLTVGAFPQAFVRTAGAITITSMHVKNCTQYGIGSMQYYPPSVQNPGRTTLTDCLVENITSNPPGLMDGTGEACYWFGNPTDASRFIARSAGWMGVFTGSKSFDSVFEDFEITMPTPAVGVYVEHETHRCTFRRFKIISSFHTGINMEWWYGGQGSHSNVFEDGEIYCAPSGGSPTRAGIFVDAGNYNNTFRRIRFWGPGNAIGLPNNLAGAGPNVVENCIFDNDGASVFYHNNAIG